MSLHSSTNVVLFFLFLQCSAILGSGPVLQTYPPLESAEDKYLIRNNVTAGTYLAYQNGIKNFLSEYQKVAPNAAAFCDYDVWPSAHSVCFIDVKTFGPCDPGHQNRTYDSNRPCVYLKIIPNNWKPSWIGRFENIPSYFPETLKQHITNTSYMEVVTSAWVNCEGEDTTDKQNLGPGIFYPRMGYYSVYFEHQNLTNYVNPIIAVQFPQVKYGVVVKVVCKLYALNANPEEHVVKFGLLLEE